MVSVVPSDSVIEELSPMKMLPALPGRALKLTILPLMSGPCSWELSMSISPCAIGLKYAIADAPLAMVCPYT